VSFGLSGSDNNTYSLLDSKPRHDGNGDNTNSNTSMNSSIRDMNSNTRNMNSSGGGGGGHTYSARLVDTRIVLAGRYPHLSRVDTRIVLAGRYPNRSKMVDVYIVLGW
jgi:hypothetical protein